MNEKERAACARFYETLHADLSALAANLNQINKSAVIVIEPLEKHEEWLH